ncbi:MAG TPA: U32 family peptidase [Bacilli bacterium]|nr:U32 family peptidase [Bacilli bacterium]
MTKILVQPINKKHIKYLNNTSIDGYIIGLKNYSIFQSLKLSIKDINKLNINNKKLYISINKPIYNNEIDDTKKQLIEISKLNITGVLFEDISIYNINKNMNLKLNLIWNQMHLPTNSLSCSYWNNKGIKGALLSTELMVDDFIKIKKDTNMIIMVYLYGYIPMFESSRTLLTNYFKYIKRFKLNKLYYLYEKVTNKYYKIYEEYNNTYILGDILNGINYLDKIKSNNIDYIVLNGVFIKEKEFNRVLNDYINNKKDDNVYTGFLNKESIFKVKKDGKK